jgi:hypothetical protein
MVFLPDREANYFCRRDSTEIGLTGKSAERADRRAPQNPIVRENDSSRARIRRRVEILRWNELPLVRCAPACLQSVMLNDREHILSALREKPLKAFEIKKRANVVNDEACQALLLKMRDEGLVKFDIHKGQWSIV